MKRFNSGMGGVTCDCCNILVCAGHLESNKILWIYSSKKFYTCQEIGSIPTSREFHFCSRACKQQFEEKHGVKLRVSVIISESKDEL